MPTKVIMPQLGESVVEGTVTRWMFNEGDSIEEYAPLLDVYTDKVETEIPSPAAGTILKILVPEGTTVQAGTLLAWIGQPGDPIPESNGALLSQSPAIADANVEANTSSIPSSSDPDRSLGFISPIVARLAGDNKVDLHDVPGTGEGGRITKKDMLIFLEKRNNESSPVGDVPPWETPGDGDLFRPTELTFKPQAENPFSAESKPLASVSEVTLIPHTLVRKRIADHMVSSKHISPHVTTVMEADMTRVAAHREKNKDQVFHQGIKLTYTAYFAAAVTSALKKFPLVNASWTDKGILLHKSVHLGLAVSLGEGGLIVPVIKGSEGLSLLGLARAINDLAERARSGLLKPDEVQNGTFTITNHGTGGSLFATPIINQPQCAILGVGIIKKRPVVVQEDAIAVRPMVYLSLAFDHRILDGDAADGFLARVVQLLEKWE